MRSVWVKVCGLRDATAARAAVEAGADALGLIFWRGSRRFVPAEAARRLVAEVPAFWVGVFSSQPLEEVMKTAAYVGVSAVQLQGDEPPDACAAVRDKLGLPVLKGLRLGPGAGVADLLEPFAPAAEALLVEGRSDRGPGGVAAPLDREVLGRAAAWWRARGEVPALVIAGGLDAANVAGVLEAAGPRGVDVSSGVETEGEKDVTKIRSFIRAVREWEDAGGLTARRY